MPTEVHKNGDWEMTALTQDQKDQFWRDGVLMVESVAGLDDSFYKAGKDDGR